jgi:uncharacterized Zn-finger protein
MCDYSYSRKDHLKRHVLSVHENKKKFQCDICDYRFSQKGDKIRHLATVHEKKKNFS